MFEIISLLDLTELANEVLGPEHFKPSRAVHSQLTLSIIEIVWIQQVGVRWIG